MARKRANRVSGIDCNLFAEKYAAALLHDSQLRIQEFSTLQTYPLFHDLDDIKKRDVEIAVRSAAKDLLCASDYKRDVVERIFRANA